MSRQCFIPLLALCCASLSLGACSYLPSWAGGEPKSKSKLEGERITVLPVNAEMQPDPALKLSKAVIPSPVLHSEWPQHGGGITASTGNIALGGKLDKAISAEVGRGNAFEHTLVIAPVVAADKVFAMDAAGNISAHEAGNIRNVKWVSKGVFERGENDIIGGGLAYDKGKLYAVSGRGIVMALDAESGKELWRKALRLPFRSAPKVEGGKLFVITVDNQSFGLNAENGDVLWNHRGISETAGMMSSVSPYAAGDVVVVPYTSGDIYLLAAGDGRELSSTAVTSNKRTQSGNVFSGIGGDPVVDGDVLFTISSGGFISVQSISTGQKIWERTIGSYNTPWIAGDNLFVLTTDNTLLNIVKYDGRIRWATQLPSYEDEEDKKSFITWKGPVMVDGKLAVVGSHGMLMLISAEDGQIVQRKPVVEGIYTVPVVAGNKMYLVDQDATLYSLQ